MCMFSINKHYLVQRSETFPSLLTSFWFGNIVGLLDCAPECWKHSLFTRKISRLQLYPWSRLLGSKIILLFPTTHTQLTRSSLLNWIIESGRAHIRTFIEITISSWLFLHLSVDWCRYWFLHRGKWSSGACNWCYYNLSCRHGIYCTGTFL